MSSLKSIVEDLRKQAEANEDRAYRILGARPGPGFDILIKPDYPINGEWYAEGLTTAGTAFVAKFWFEQPLSNQKVAECKKQANEWCLTYRVIIPIERLDD